MGMTLGCGSSYDESKKSRKKKRRETCNCDWIDRSTFVNPEKFTILQLYQIADHVVALVHYPECTNFEGKKILLFENTTTIEISDRKILDPHFSINRSLFARFVPTKKGLRFAMKCAMFLSNQETV
jgi:hypothetical protein